MSKRVTVDLDLPDDVANQFQPNELQRKMKESLVMEFLREHRISQGKAAELLGVSRNALFPLLSKYQVPVTDLTDEELGAELDKPFRAQQ